MRFSMVSMRACMSSEDFHWDDLRLFLAAYRARSITAGAAALGLNQSTMSRRLRGLEKTLAVHLFERTPEGLLPTQAAETLVAAAERAEAASHDVLRLMAGREQLIEGEVRLAISDAMALHLIAPALPRFREKHANVRVSLVVGNAISDLTRHEADMALRFVRPQRGDLVAKRIVRSRCGVFAAPVYADRIGRRRRHRLEELDWVGWDEITAGHLADARALAPIAQRTPVTSNSMSIRLALTQAGAGAIMLPTLLGDALPGLVRLRTPALAFAIEIWLVTHRALRDVPRIRALWSFIEDAFAVLLPKPARDQRGTPQGGA